MSAKDPKSEVFSYF